MIISKYYWKEIHMENKQACNHYLPSTYTGNSYVDFSGSTFA